MRQHSLQDIGREDIDSSPADSLESPTRTAEGLGANYVRLNLATSLKLKDIKRLPMVRWFDIKQLASTAVKVIFSTIIGEQTDKRIIQALSSAGKDI